MKYKKKPIVVEAIQFKQENWKDVLDFLNFPREENGDYEIREKDGAVKPNPGDNFVIVISTLEGDMTVSKGDYIIKGIQGELYPCKPDIFEQTYELAE